MKGKYGRIKHNGRIILVITPYRISIKCCYNVNDNLKGEVTAERQKEFQLKYTKLN